MENRAEFVTAVVGRYGGVVEVLAGILRGAGIVVATTWAADANPPTAQPPLVRGMSVVVTVGPGDTTLHRMRAVGLRGTVVAIVWHPDEEIGHIPGPHRIVRAGEIRATLPEAVRTLPMRSTPSG